MKSVFFLLFSIMAFAEVVEVNRNNYGEVVENSTLPVILDVYATWCGPCKQMKQVFDEVSNAYQGKIVFAKIDFDRQGDPVKNFGITGLPTILFFKKGKKAPAMKQVGYINKSDFEAQIKQFLGK
jgi:thioredoxin 1